MAHSGIEKKIIKYVQTGGKNQENGHTQTTFPFRSFRE